MNNSKENDNGLELNENEFENENYDESNNEENYENEEENKEKNIESIIKEFEKKKYIPAILNSINKIRSLYNLKTVYEDVYFSYLAKDYAKYLIENDHYSNFFESYAKKRKIKPSFYENTKIIYSRYKFEEDFDFSQDELDEILSQTINSIIESNQDIIMLLDKNINAIGLNIYINENNLCLCLLANKRKMIIENMKNDSLENIFIQAKNLSKWGLKFIKISDFETEKEIKIVGPECINYDKNKGIFSITINLSEKIEEPLKLFDFCFYQNINEIKYGKKDKSNYSSGFNNGNEENRILGFIYPKKGIEYNIKTKIYQNLEFKKSKTKKQQSFKNEDIIEFEDKKLKEEDINEKIKNNNNDEEFEEDDDEEEKTPSENENSEEYHSDNNLDPKDEEEEDEESEIKKKNFVDNKTILEELKNAIKEAKKERDIQLHKNQILQEKILYFMKENNISNERTGDVTMSDIKYSNTLAHVHQIKQELDNTSKKYTEMAQDLKNKLDEKTNKCSELKVQFMHLKRTISQKAIFLKTMKPISEESIKFIEEKEYEKAKQLHKLRLELLKLNTILNKNSKQIKKKEELAEGLHLIDFEQLKIENQSLTEKIEERNEDLHKLKKKNTTTIQILTHTIEKLNFETKQLNENNDKKNKLNERYQKLKDEVRNLKLQKEEFRKEKIILSQETGILNSKILKTDFKNRIKNKEKLETKKNILEKKLEEMIDMIDSYTAEIKKKYKKQKVLI